jgi:hypothetical protein
MIFRPFWSSCTHKCILLDYSDFYDTNVIEAADDGIFEGIPGLD